MFIVRRTRIPRQSSSIYLPTYLNVPTASFTSSPLSSPSASSSKQPYTPRPYNSQSDVKGKGRAIDHDHQTPQVISSGIFGNNPRHSTSHSSTLTSIYTHRRCFHATHRRDAIPLLPASIAILKGTSILTAATAFSRIIISFFPIGTLAAFKMAHAGKWLEKDVVEPKVSEEATEFWKMWCEDEKWISLSKEDAEDFLDSDYDETLGGGMIGKKGQIAYPVPFPYSRFGRGGRHRSFSSSNITSMSPKHMRECARNDDRKVINWIRKGNFFIPPLHPASKVSWEELTASQQGEVEQLRRYWLGLKVFKHWYRISRWFIGIVFGLPFLVLISVYLAGLERVPLTGRWRLILLTPEEEDTISNSLSGSNWYKSVINLLTTAESPAPPIIPPNDWRWNWVQSTLSKLENAILVDCHTLTEDQKVVLKNQLQLQKTNQGDLNPIIAIPPPAYHPIKPRPRVSSRLHSVLPGEKSNSGQEHLEIGPPYNLMLMEKNEENAFSYGFGGKRAGGIVVFTGLLDMILRPKANTSTQSQIQSQVDVQQPISNTSNRGFFSSLFSSPKAAPSNRTPPQPTEEQTLQLACVLAHEMGHLLLSHHLETLSQQQVLWPSVLGLSMDLVRAFIWPFTWFLGPTVNDALANVGRTSTEELADKYGEIGFQYIHEYEADLAGLRILALAGYDPHQALSYFSTSVADLHEIQPIDKSKKDNSWTGSMFKLWTRATHPTPEKRLEAIRDELTRWEKEAEKTKMEEEQGKKGN
ncbi:hypothetical protein L486_00636 [Kwoniella mangroviensis CBS 10435]|uniref:Peptidase M48 domain-containing protein n=1 Tax=Kwoniella mangroviensis CBS 10435 TaxID=1331196 RepID=A0A1B9IZR1_9TREE|nr:hypothetical protein L486_00636 [Kwoniella mangroviensis CBS 10435]